MALISIRYGKSSRTHLALSLGSLYALLSPVTANAQTVEPVVQLAPVVVTATRHPEDPLTVPAAVDVIDAAQIRRAQPVVNLSESLERIPGVVARNRQNYAQDLQISIRGFGARSTFGVRGVRLYNDDIPATTPDGQGQVSHFNLASAQRIEVLRGPFSALYGNASGGVIKLFTADAPADPQLGADLVLGSNGLRRSTLSWHAPWGRQEDGDLLLDLTNVRSDGYRRHGAATRNTGQLLLRGQLPGDGRYTVLLNSLKLEAQDPQGLTAGQLEQDRRAASSGALAFDTRKRLAQDQLGLHVEQPISAANSLVLTAYATQRHTEQMLSVPVAVQRDNPLQGGGALALDRDDFGMDGRWEWSARLIGQPLLFVAGVDYEVSDEVRRGYENFSGNRLGVFGALRRDETDRVASRDVYAQSDWQPTDRLHVDVGVRRSNVRFGSRDRYITADNPDDSGHLGYARVSPVAGVLFRVTPRLSVYANAGGGFETPTFAELAYRSDGRSGLNDQLRPARSRNYELGVRARYPALEYSANVFQSRTRDDLVVAANQGGRSSYANAALSGRRGLELAISGTVSGQWHYAAAYTLLDARYLRDFSVCSAPPCTQDNLIIEKGRLIPGLSRQWAWGELRWSPSARIDFLLDGRFASRIFVDDANSAAAPASAAFDLGVERHFTFAGVRWRAFARLGNILDRSVVGSVIVNDSNGRYFEPAPGRNWLIGLSAEHEFK